jgi:hypothetical protein
MLLTGLSRWAFGRASRNVPDSLLPLVLLLESPLHVEIKLAFLLDALLFNVSQDALAHSLCADLC